VLQRKWFCNAVSKTSKKQILSTHQHTRHGKENWNKKIKV